MKRNLFITAIILTISTIVVLQSCEKKEMIETENGTIENQILSADKTAPLLTSSDINWILTNEDKEMVEINKNLFYLGAALTEVVMNEKTISDIGNAVRKSKLNSVSFDDLIAQNSNILEAINNKLNSTQLTSFYSSEKNFNFDIIASNFIYDKVEYRPVIHIPNIENADFSLIPMISPGIEIADDNEKGIKNAIIAWKYIENSWEEFYLTEDEALIIKNPVMIVSFNTIKNLKTTDDIILFNGKNEIIEDQSKSTYKHNCIEFNIAYRYESSGASDYNIAGFSRLTSGEIITECDYEVQEVDKDDIGDNIASNFFICHTQTSDRKTIFNTYERDWYASAKFLGRIYTTSMYGKMVVESEWYAFNPSTNNETNLWVFPTSGTKVLYSKGHMKINASLIGK